MGSKTRLSSYCTKRANNGMNLVTSRKINTRLARPIVQLYDILMSLFANKSNAECGIIRPTNEFTWDHIHYLEVAINIL